MLDLWKYKYFVDVVEYKSFTKAGKKNFVSQTAISQQISYLEKTIGEKLLERGNGELRLTVFGEIVYTRAKEMLKINQQMLREIQHLKDENIIRVGVDSSICKIFWRKMQEVVDEYYCEDDFQFHKIDLNIACKLMEEKELDIYIGYEIDRMGELFDIVEEKLDTHKIGIHLGNKSTLIKDRELRLEDLAGYDRYATKSYPCSIQEKALRQCEGLSRETKYVSNIDTMKLKVELKDGYMFADSYYFSYAEGDIYMLEDYHAECTLKAFYRKNNGKVNKFVKRLSDKFFF